METSPETLRSLFIRSRRVNALQEATAEEELEQLHRQQPQFATLQEEQGKVTIRVAKILRSQVSTSASQRHADKQVANLEALINTVVDGNAEHVEVDMAAIDFVSEEVLGQLISLGKQLRKQGRTLHFVNASPSTMEKCNTTRLNTIIPTSGRPAEQELPDTVDS